MKRELGKWFMDVAKFLLTAGLITPWIDTSEFVLSGMTLILVGLAVLVLSLGLYLIRQQEKMEEKREKNRNKKKK